ncbi:MAG: YhbY family RNA-binding protein [Oscillospiraceae bacterium]|nr:YhbY family RNA-binding protein [Oscillospiraceae bacterium]MCD7749640.1 YhbY family RNA-binding protein [Oscillospiraceae bacterium]
MLSGKQRAYLRSLAQKEEAILYVGKAGVTEPVIAEARDALAARELVKGRVQEASMLTAAEAQAALCQACQAEGVQVIGNVFVLYKKRDNGAKIILPKG